jgi:hypothetical protein
MDRKGQPAEGFEEVSEMAEERKVLPLEEALDTLIFRTVVGLARSGEDAQGQQGRWSREPTLESLIKKFAGSFSAEEVRASVNRLAIQKRIEVIAQIGEGGGGGAVALKPWSA